MFIKVRVVTGAPKEVIQEISNDHIEMYLREPPERGLANKRVLQILKEKYPNQPIRIVNGHHSPSKLVEIGNGSK